MPAAKEHFPLWPACVLPCTPTWPTSSCWFCRRICSTHENLDFRYGAFSGYTIGMVFITLQASLVIQASAYLADVEVDLVTSGPLTELQLFNTAALLGYLTCALFLVLYLFIATHQCAVCCGCCPPIKESKPQPANSVPLAERRSDPLKPASSKPGPVE
mmetsp:Transcript_9089/g.26073  ORF Transcript_9089/g.26073 Transcript_9089/m.26073 type:complete len:159 (+) Transcript_9089:864-1340(+)